MPSLNYIDTALAEYAAAVTAGTQSAELDVIRDTAGMLLGAILGPSGLQAAFGHPPGVIGAKPPFGVCLWAEDAAFVKTGAYTPSAAGQDYTGYGGGDMDEEGELILFIAVAPLTADLPTLQRAAERWRTPLKFLVTNHPDCYGTVEGWEWRRFSMGVLTWGDTPWYAAAGHTTVRTLTTAPVPLS